MMLNALWMALVADLIDSDEKSSFYSKTYVIQD